MVQETPTHSTTSPTPAEWLAIGRDYLQLGFSIIPVRKNKKPLFDWKGYQHQKATDSELKAWVENKKFGGFAVVTGKISSVFVLDIDTGANIDDWQLPLTLNSLTGTGGLHYFFHYPSNQSLYNTTGLRPHVDIRGEGGYAILPPSLHPNGNRYKWVTDLKTPVAEAPTWLLDLIANKNTIPTEQKTTKYQDIKDGVTQGKRNDGAACFIGHWLKKTQPNDWELTVWSKSLNWNQKNQPPLSESELRTVFDSICQREVVSQLQGTSKGGNGNQNMADRLVKVVLAQNIDLFTNEFRDAMMAIPEKPNIAIPIESQQGRDYLSKLHWDSLGKAISKNTQTSVINTLKGFATFEGKTHSVYNRIARVNDTIYYDLGDDRQFIEVTPSDWRVTTKVPVYFQRYSHQAVQVIPEPGGDLKDFLKFLNLKEKYLEILILTYLPVAFFPDIARYILIFCGDYGAAKSTSQALTRSLIDPSNALLLTPTTSEDHLVQQASHNYALMLDNLSWIKRWFSDCLCRFVTGNGSTRRKLYTNDDDLLYYYKRVIGINGINQVATQPDLLSRCLVFSLERIPDNQRKEEKVIWEQFEAAKPKLLGSIFDCLSYMLREAPNLKITGSPRMADYYRYALAASGYLNIPEVELQKAFDLNNKAQNREAFNASAVAQSLVQFAREQKKLGLTSWEGTSSELHARLLAIATAMAFDKTFPKQANWLWRRIKEVRSTLSAWSIEVECAERNYGSFITVSWHDLPEEDGSEYKPTEDRYKVSEL